ncbi:MULTISPECIES: type VII secretion-associated serine protease mycosin [Mycobacterium]|uniref:Type VII secretion-associated serine protease mycosin n=1 Tax=Mycobacterium paragordonae TaxID=1389713 RepID=A0AAJ1S8F0_9MYCO|nr:MULTISPECIES: type VII secretion-associated serine protease mycosin [Mycobacterium]MBI2699720.1 type VII secretion-associated serine protease mycosin [Mycobacterium sp.]MDP7739232.1 type VII secretion-associated serine protease mycosin [Mycobacterium paragordonae]PJE02612.1 MAG: type VII secretion-associated serine protease mycosin [Mycobacterium sp.]PJE10705.1 MAG: type VII secretion-associated serine protease mycosin [Mycobacterium sp.]PJE25355.1 MAG: type VII secretion-associated serine 
MMRRLAPIAATAALLMVCTPAPPAAALAFPIVDPVALPPDGPPTPEQDMRQNGTCAFFGAMPGFDPAAVPPSQAMLNLPEAWKTSRGRGVVVAVIDSGVTPGPRLPNLTAGGDYIDPPAGGLVDCDGHGSAVAGLIAGQPGPDGFSGVAPEAALVSIRQSSAQWSPKTPSGQDPQQAKTAGDVATLARAVRHAADIPGVRVINISLTDCIPTYKQVEQAALGAALRYAAIDKDIVVVAAAGNTGESNCTSNALADPNRPDDPRNWAGATTISTPSYWQPYVLSVASLTPEGQPSNFTMAGPWVSVAGPGEQIVSLGNAPNSGLVNGQPSSKEPLVAINGTSFASAYVSGAAALVRSKFPTLTARQVVNRLVSSAHNAARAPSNVVGAGVIDPVAALTWDIPSGEALPTQMPVVRVPPPAPPAPDHRLPRFIAFGVGILAVTLAIIFVTVIGMRRDRRDS